MTEALATIIDLIRYGASRFNAAGLTFGHSYDNALDEATQLTLHALHLPHVLAAAAAGKHVYCEKPMEISVERCQQMIDACRKAGVWGT